MSEALAPVKLKSAPSGVISKPRRWFAFADCPVCLSSMSCGDWLLNKKEAIRRARANLSGHMAKHHGSSS